MLKPEPVLAFLADKGRFGRINLARKIGVDSQTLNKWLKGGCNPRPASVQRLAEAISVPMDELIERVNDEQTSN